MNRVLDLTRRFVSIPSVNSMGGTDDDPVFSEKHVADVVFDLLASGGT